jgi:hypothetical protein
MLKIPFKRPESVDFETPLSKAIVQIFEEDPNQYRADFEALESLRMSIMAPQPHEASAQFHQRFVNYFILVITDSYHSWNQSFLFLRRK